MRLPSGDQVGADSRQLPSVNWRSLSPLTSITQRFDAFWSRGRSTNPREKTTCDPSGEICGFDTDSIWKNVLLSRYFGYGDWPAAGRTMDATSAAANRHRVDVRMSSLLVLKDTPGWRGNHATVGRVESDLESLLSSGSHPASSSSYSDGTVKASTMLPHRTPPTELRPKTPGRG